LPPLTWLTIPGDCCKDAARPTDQGARQAVHKTHPKGEAWRIEFDLFRTTVFHCSNAFFGSVGELVLVVIQSELPGGSAPDRIAVYFN